MANEVKFMKQDYIECGKLVGTHGIRGTLRVQPWCDSPEFLTKFKKLYIKSENTLQPLNIKSSKAHKNIVLMDIEFVETIEQAEALRNKIIYIDRRDLKLENGQYLISDLIGCNVFDRDSGKSLGTISDVSKTGANDIWHIKYNDKEYLIPVIDEVVISVDIEAGKVIIAPLAGIFDEE